jgi:hypothetical protein
MRVHEILEGCHPMSKNDVPTAMGLCGGRTLLFGVLLGASMATSSGCSTVASMAMSGASPQAAGLTAEMETMTRSVSLVALQGYVGGYALLKPGEYARYRVPAGVLDGSRAGVVEVANLGKGADEGTWWRVKFVEADTMAKSTVEFALSDAGELIMMRRKFPIDREVVVQKPDRNHPWLRNAKVNAPKDVSTEGVQIIDKGMEDVAVPAGTFKAKHVVYQGNSGSTDLWSADAVAGKSVRIKNAIAPKDGRPRREVTIELEAYGTGATSETGLVLPR